jgi:hypothetical protein
MNKEEKVYAFYWVCFSILTRVFLVGGHVGNIDKDILRHVFADFEEDSYLSIDYGSIAGPMQLWECVPGEEVCHTWTTVRGQDESKANPVLCSIPSHIR